MTTASLTHVSQFFRRLFVLDRQIEFVGDQNLFKAGRWLGRKWREATRRLKQADKELTLGGFNEAELQKEWDAQVKAQLEPAPRKLYSMLLFDRVVDLRMQANLSTPATSR